MRERKTTMATLTNAQIRAIRDSAKAMGANDFVAICDVALSTRDKYPIRSIANARRIVVNVINEST